MNKKEEETMTPIEKAKMIARIVHCDKPYDEHDYDYHLEQVYKTLLRFGVTEENILVAAWLHDSVEDTQMKLKLIREYFNDDVADLVHCVTNELGPDKREMLEKTYPKIRKNQRACALKLADRIANVEQSILKKNTRMFNRYRGELPGFIAAVKMDGSNEEMWKHLEMLLLPPAV